MASRSQFQFWIFFILNIILLQLASTLCPSGWSNVTTGGNPNQTCFRVFTSEMDTFNSAAAVCRGQGGYLARDTSQTVHDALKQIVLASKAATLWIGLTDNANGSWMWVDGPLLGSYSNFGVAPNTPNKTDCVYISAIDSNMKWQAVSSCDSLYPFVCQRDINASMVVVTTPAPPNCQNGWTNYQQTCFRLFTGDAVGWQQARSKCQDLSGDLIKIENYIMNAVVNMVVSDQKDIYWIGLNDRANEGLYVWLDETVKTNFTNWDDYMPDNKGGNENCVTLDGFKNFKWDDYDCNVTAKYICQKSPYPGTPAPATTIASNQSLLNCEAGWDDGPNSEYCLKFNTNVLTWLDARSDCQSVGGDLVSVVNVQDQFFLGGRSVAFQSSLFWIGANDRATERGWVWSDGSPFAFLNWDAQQPDDAGNSDCAALVTQTGQWNDLPCQNRYGYICKKQGKATVPPLLTTSTTPKNLPGDVIFGCPSGWSPYGGVCYKVVQSFVGVDWATASASCSDPNVNGVLAAITDYNENQFIYSLIPKNYFGNAWIGLQDSQQNTFTWVDGTPVVYTNWNPGEPNNLHNENCVVMQATNGQWNSFQCDLRVQLYICKKSKSILSIADTSENQGCVNSTIGYGSKCYTFVSSGTNFDDAQSHCRSTFGSQGNLATIDSGHLQAFLSAQLVLMPYPTYWIGLSQSGGTYKWQSSWPIVFTYWGKNHTGNEQYTCVAMQQASPAGLWNNYPCGLYLPYICESPRSGFTTQTTSSTVTSQLPCPPGWGAYGNHCYLAFLKSQEARLTWSDARDFCTSQADGGTLATIPDNDTQNWFIQYKPPNVDGNLWIGLNDRDSESGYVWTDNSPVIFTNWGVKEPDDDLNREDCVEWDITKNIWNDQYCYLSNNWICQVPRGSVIATVQPPPTGNPSPECGNAPWVLYNYFCYYVSPPYGDSSLASWFEARQHCMDLGADLVSITGDDENGFITSLITKINITSFWTGLNDLDMETYGWTDKSPVSFVAWGMNEPNDNFGEEKCVEITSIGTWNDAHCQNTFGYVCKKQPGDATQNFIKPTIATGGCPRDFVSLPSLSFCYYVGGTTNDTRKNYDDALTACSLMAHKPTLASIHNSQEEKFILVLLSGLDTPAWIGFNDRMTRNQFQWVDNLEVSYTNWGPGQPDENLHDNSLDARRDCVDMEIRRTPGTWNDRQCETELAYVCESKKGETFPTTVPNNTGCHPGYQRFRNSCYRFYEEFLNQTLAESICVADGGHLITINNGIEQAFAEILTQHTDSAQFWIGLKYSLENVTFAWANGWPVSFTNWAYGEPNPGVNNTCVSHTIDGQWHVMPCQRQLLFICEVNFGGPPPSRPIDSQGKCPDFTWSNYAGSCYCIINSPLTTWALANDDCKALGADLASIHSDTESLYVKNAAIKLGLDIWIGLYKGQQTGFSWFDGTALQYTNWGDGEPSDPAYYMHEDCVKISNQSAKWADADCDDHNAFICKMPQLARPSLGPNSTYPSRPTGRRTSPRSFSTQFSVRPGQSSNPSLGPTTSRTPQQNYTGHPEQVGSPGNTGSDLSKGQVAGIVIGTLMLVGLAVVISFVAFRYSRGQCAIPFTAQRLISPGSKFSSATYSSSNEDNVNLAVPET